MPRGLEKPLNIHFGQRYIQKDTRWRNKQRCLVFCSRGVTARRIRSCSEELAASLYSRFRHLCDDIRKMLPHHKAEPKFEKRSNFNEINEAQLEIHVWKGVFVARSAS